MANIPYRIVDPGSNTDLYRKLVKDYWNWVEGSNPDSDPKNPNDPNVTFLRDDIIGGPLKHEVGIARGRRTNEDVPFSTPKITVYPDTKLFFPVYHCLSVDAHPYVKGGTCDSHEKRKDAVKIDLANNFEKWAKINGEEINLQNHYIETVDEFDLIVPDNNNLKREAGFKLEPRETPYRGFAAGTYVCLENLEIGEYKIDFGGRATDFHSESNYTVIVIQKP